MEARNQAQLLGRRLQELRVADWRRQWPDSETVAQAQATVLAWFRELLRRLPELLPGNQPLMNADGR